MGALTRELQNQISDEIGPEIATAREQLAALERLQGELQAGLQELSRMSN